MNFRLLEGDRLTAPQAGALLITAGHTGTVIYSACVKNEGPTQARNNTETTQQERRNTNRKNPLGLIDFVKIRFASLGCRLI